MMKFKNTKLRRTLILTTFLSSIGGHIYAAAMGGAGAGGADEVSTVTTLMGRVASSTSRENPFRHLNAVVFVGPTGSGKSTLMNGIAGRPLATRASTTGGADVLDSDTYVEGSRIGHKMTSETRAPSAWHDTATDTVYWDCPGFGDTAGSAQEIVNAFGLQRLFESPMRAKVVLAVNERYLDDKSEDFLRLLNDITAGFPRVSELQRGFSLIVTKQRDIDVRRRLAAITETATAEEHGILSPESKILLQFLNANISTRVSVFPRPTAKGDYVFPLAEILRGINSSEFIENPTAVVTVRPAARINVLELGASINRHIKEHIRTRISSQIIEASKDIVRAHNDSVGSLRAIFHGKERELENLMRIDQRNAREFPATLRRMFSGLELTPIHEMIDQITFLRQLSETPFNITDWAAGLTGVRDKINALIARPKCDLSEGVLTLSGMLLGTSDLLAAFEERDEGGRRRMAREIRLFSFASLFLDADITAPGVSLSLIAPTWNMLNRSTTIDLSGLPGESHDAAKAAIDEVGLSGKAGENAGNFFGKAKRYTAGGPSTHLTILANGGRGGPGQDGGDGHAGEPGVDGSL